MHKLFALTVNRVFGEHANKTSKKEGCMVSLNSLSLRLIKASLSLFIKRFLQRPLKTALIL